MGPSDREDGVLGNRHTEPWNFSVYNVKEMLAEVTGIVNRAGSAEEGISEVELLVAINHCNHISAELERSRLEMSNAMKRGQFK